MEKKNKISKFLLLLMMIVAMMGVCCISAGATTVSYRTIPHSQTPVKIGNSYVWATGEFGDGIRIKKSKNSSVKEVKWENWGTLGGVTDGEYMYVGEQLTSDTSGTLILRKYSIATGKTTKYKTIKDVYGGTVSGYYKNRMYYCYLKDSYKLRVFDTKTMKDSVVNNSFDTFYSYGRYIFGCSGGEGLKVYNMETKKFTTLSKKGWWNGSDKGYAGYYYYPRYIDKASNNMNKYKIYKFNLKTGKSAPVSKTFEASGFSEVTNKKVTYIKQGNKEYTLKY